MLCSVSLQRERNSFRHRRCAHPDSETFDMSHARFDATSICLIPGLRSQVCPMPSFAQPGVSHARLGAPSMCLMPLLAHSRGRNAAKRA